MPLNLSIKNLEQLTAEIKAYPQDIEKIINAEFKLFGQSTANNAKQLSPINEGALRGSINFTVDNLHVAVGAYIEYAAFLEFGTKSFAASYVATLPTDWQEFAAQYKGSGGGSFADLLRSIMKWVELKGIGAFQTASGKSSKSKSSLASQKQAAYLIARSIIQKGIREHPFLYPAFEINKVELINNLKRELNVK